MKTGDAARRRTDAAGLEEGLGFFNNILLGFAGVALFVGIFLILNTFSIIVAQRTRELALMRAIGASRRQMIGSVLVEAVVIGLIAVGARAGGRDRAPARCWPTCSATSPAALELAGIGVPPAAVIARFTVGMLVTVVAALLPALRASRIPPVAAMQEVATPDRPLTKITVTGALVGAAGGPRCGARPRTRTPATDAAGDPRRRAGQLHRRRAADPADHPAGGGRCSGGCSPGRCRASWAG